MAVQCRVCSAVHLCKFSQANERGLEPSVEGVQILMTYLAPVKLPFLLTLHPFCFSGNKGAVGISFIFNGTSFGFVNCHLTSGNEKTAR